MRPFINGKYVKITRQNNECETWIILAIRTLQSSGQKLIRVRHITGFTAHIMMHDIKNIVRL